MNESQINIIDCFTQLIAYTLEFSDNYKNEVYTIEKLTTDYEKLIVDAQNSFRNHHIKDDFNDALFPIVAWIDETILNSKYIEKKLWRKTLLQKKFFSTSNAGIEFFEKLDKLPTNAFDIRLLYMYTLLLGFKGRYYKKEDQDSLNRVFKEQKKFVQDNFTDKFSLLSFDSAYPQNPLPQQKEFKTSYKWFWVTVAISLVGGLIVYLSLQAHLNHLLNKSNIF